MHSKKNIQEMAEDKNLFTKNSKTAAPSSNSLNGNPHRKIITGILAQVMQVYGINCCWEISIINRILSVFQLILIHLMPFYILSMSIITLYNRSSFDEAAFGFALVGIFPLVLHYIMKSKISTIQHILNQYSKLNFCLENETRNCGAKNINATVIVIIFSSILASFASTLTLSHDSILQLYYSFYINLEDDILGNSIRFCLNQLLFAHQYVYPCIIAMICGFLFYEFGTLLQRFHGHLPSLKVPMNRNQIVSVMKLYFFLYEVAHKLRDATSLICFVLLSCQLTTMYGSLAVFILNQTKDISAPQICESILVITLVPTSILIMTSCASKIASQQQKIEIRLSLLRNKLNLQNNRELETLRILNLMMDYKFPVMSAFALGKLTPNLVLNMLGSLFTYTLLILNLKNSRIQL